MSHYEVLVQFITSGQGSMHALNESKIDYIYIEAFLILILRILGIYVQASEFRNSLLDKYIPIHI